MQELECPDCQRLYNENDRCPTVVPWGHTYCLACINNQISTQQKFICKLCDSAYQPNMKTMTNFALKRLLDDLKITWDRHQSEQAEQFRSDNQFQLLCHECSIGQDCMQKITVLRPWLQNQIDTYKRHVDFSQYPDVFQKVASFSLLNLQDQVNTYKYCLENLEQPQMAQQPQAGPMMPFEDPSLPPLPEGVNGIRLPIDGEFNGEIKLNRFLTIRQTANYNHEVPVEDEQPWFVNQDKDQIELVSFSTTASVRLTGVSIARSAFNDTIMVKYLDVKHGNSSGSPLIKRELVDKIIMPRSIYNPTILQPFMFEEPIQVSPYQKYTIEFKITNTKGMLCGDGRTRPEVCIGADSTIWEFTETRRTTDLYSNGTNHVAGPLLQIFYTEVH